LGEQTKIPGEEDPKLNFTSASLWKAQVIYAALKDSWLKNDQRA